MCWTTGRFLRSLRWTRTCRGGPAGDCSPSAVIGSINLAPGSFDERRELATERRARADRAAEGDHAHWENSKALDLSDEGVLADLNRHGLGGAKQLAIKCGGGKKK